MRLKTTIANLTAEFFGTFQHTYILQSTNQYGMCTVSKKIRKFYPPKGYSTMKLFKLKISFEKGHFSVNFFASIDFKMSFKWAWCNYTHKKNTIDI